MQDTLPPEPLSTFMLDVGDGHAIYVEESGNPNGLPLINFHGGPGSQCKPKHRARYDLEKFRLIQFDQRHCGQSIPKATEVDTEAVSHDPADIVADAERIRLHLGLTEWHVAGASWGSAMALFYAVTYPQATRSLTLRALFLSQESNWAWMAEGARLLAPPAYRAAKAFAPDKDGGNLVRALADTILTADRTQALAATKALLGMEQGLEILTEPKDESQPEPEAKPEADLLNAGLLYATVIKRHMFKDGWAVTPEAKAALVGKPFAIVHGACDTGCLIKNVYDLKEAHPHAELSIAQNAGHGVDLNGDYQPLYRAALARLTA